MWEGSGIICLFVWELSPKTAATATGDVLLNGSQDYSQS